MDQSLIEQMVEMVQREAAPLHAKIDILESEVDRLYNHIVELEKKMEEQEGWSASRFDEEPIQNIEAPEGSGEEDEALLKHLLSEENRKLTDALPNSSHVTLTIDLSKKEL